MRSLLAVTFLGAAATAAAQVQTGGAVEGHAGLIVVPSVSAQLSRELSSTMPPFLSLSPSLSASAVVLPVLTHPSAAVPNALPLSSPHAVAASSSKGDEIRAEAYKAIVAGRASRAARSSAKDSAFESPSPAEYAVKLDELFDGSLPTSGEVLSRAESLGLGRADVALAISKSASAPDAAARLSALGVLGAKEAVLSESVEDDFRFLLTRLWRKTAAGVASSFPVDRSLAIAALKVRRDGVTYYVHAVAHGQLGAPRRSSVLFLVRQVEASGHALYSEQNLPAHYGYKKGLETLDHAAAEGAEAAVVAAAPGYTRAALLLKRALDWAAAPGGALAALAWVLVAPASPPAWILLLALGALAWRVMTGGLPVMRWKRRRRAAAAQADGLVDIAEQYADEARNFIVSKPDLEVLRSLELPQPLGATADAESARSRAIADAVAADVAASGACEAHLIVGHQHAHEVAWRLAYGPRRQVQGPIIS